MGVPTQFKKLATTKPWYRTGFVFVAKDNEHLPQSFDDPKLREFTIGVPATGLGDTPPMLALTSRGLSLNVHPYSVFRSEDLISDVQKDLLNLAIVWGPFGGWYAAEKKMAIKPTPDNDGYIPLVFDYSIGVSKKNLQLKTKLDQILDQKKEALQGILVKWHVPLRKFQ
jgi:mxaJ protein